MRLEFVTQLNQLRILLRHLLVHFLQRLRCANTGDNILALRIGQVFTEHLVLAGTGITRESDAGCTIVAHVAEDHGADIHRSAVCHIRRDVEFATIIDRALAHPGTKDRLDRELQLQHYVLRKVLARLAMHHG